MDRREESGRLGRFSRVGSLIRRVLGLLRRGQVRMAAKSVGRLLWSTNEEYGLRRDLSLPIEVEPTDVDFEVRPLQRRDLDRMLEAGASDSPLQAWRLRRLLDADIPTCWVAVDREGLLCFVMWVIGPEQNHLMRREIGPTFRPLGPDEVLLESGFTPSPYRGQRVGLEAGKRIVAAACPDARWAWAFTSIHNQAALTSLLRGGSVPVLKMRSKWRLLRQTVDFEELPPGADVLRRDPASAD